MKPIKARIIELFASKDYDFYFRWGKNQEKWGAKYETIHSLSKTLNCPKTSLYTPIKQLVSEGVITFNKIIYQEEKIKP